MAKSNTSIARVIATCSKQIAIAVEALGKTERMLTARERKQLVKPRPQLRQIAPAIVELAPKYGVQLSGELSVETLAARIDDADRFRPLLVIVEKLHKLLNDMVLRAESEAWDAAMANYSALRHVSERSGELEGELAPVIAALATGPRVSDKPSGGNAASSKPAAAQAEAPATAS